MEWKVQRVRDSVMLLGMAGALLLVEGHSAVAQTPLPTLTLRPQEMATATQTAMAGRQGVDGKPWQSGVGRVYVPQQCVGAKRCSLVIITNVPEKEYIYIADKYGMIVAYGIDGSWSTSDPAALDHGLQKILQSFAIDPDKIAIMGRAATGQATVDLATANPNVFSLVLNGTQEMSNPPVKAPKQRLTEYFIASGLIEGNPVMDGSWTADFEKVQQLRDRGYRVTYSFQFRASTHTHEEYDFIGHWLQERWAIPDPAARPVPYTFGDPPLLTDEILAKMTAFWTRFMQEPESIKTTARQALVREVLVPIGKERISTLMADMPALAAKHSSVAAALTEAKLTPEQYDAYRAALVSALAYGKALHTGTDPWSTRVASVQSLLGVAPTSAVAKNFEVIHQQWSGTPVVMGMLSTP